jgi:hypothetical protein
MLPNGNIKKGHLEKLVVFLFKRTFSSLNKLVIDFKSNDLHDSVG